MREKPLLPGVCVVGLLFISSCATSGAWSNRSKTIALTIASGVVASGVGALVAPEGDRKAAHAALWGGGAAAGAGIVGLFVFDEEAKTRETEAKNAKLEKELAAYRDEINPEMIATNNLIGVSKPLPAKFKNLIIPGQWSLYKTDRWSTSSDNELVHQDLIFRFSQPQLNPSGKTPLTQGDK